MKKLLVALLLIAGAVYGFKAWDKQRSANAAKVRVETVLRAMVDNDPQTAIGVWSENREKLDMAGLAAYQLRFQTFWSDSGLAAGSRWAVASVQADPDGDDHLVTVQSGDQRVVLRVPANTLIGFVPQQ